MLNLHHSTVQQANILLKIYILHFPTCIIIFIKTTLVIMDKNQKKQHSYIENKYISGRGAQTKNQKVKTQIKILKKSCYRLT